MSVMIVTSLGDLVVDLFTERCPLTCKNFLKLCKIKYYNGCLFHTVQKDFTAQTGDPTGTGTGGDSIYKFLYGDQARFFGDEIHFDVKHSKMGTVAMASAGKDLNASQFYITLRDDLDYLDGKHTVFGEIAEGLDTLSRINDTYVDGKSRPYKNIRIKHTYILDDPFDDPQSLAELIPGASPEGKPKDEVDDDARLEDDWVPLDEQLNPQQIEELLSEKDARSRALVLEAIEDIPDAEIKPPDNVLFVCKLNPVTEDEDLHTIFSRFGVVTSAEVIRDHKTGDSLCYAFIEFKDVDACEQAYFKMDNVLIDDRRIHVDFSQSVAKLWSQYRRKGRGGQGGGCNKCGSFDHSAKDCTGDSTFKQPQTKFELKDDNIQHGGAGSKRYDMVFAEDDDTDARNTNRRDHDEKRNSRRPGGHHPDHKDSKRRHANEGGRQHDHDRISERRGDEGYTRHRGTEVYAGKDGSNGGRRQDPTTRRSSGADEREHSRRYDDEVKHKRGRDEGREKSHSDYDGYGYGYGYKNDKRRYEKGAADDGVHGQGKRGDKITRRSGAEDPKRSQTDGHDARHDKYGHKHRGEERYSSRSSENDDFHDRGRRH